MLVYERTFEPAGFIARIDGFKHSWSWDIDAMVAAYKAIASTMEIWRTCVECSNYEVSSFGRVRRSKPGKCAVVGRFSIPHPSNTGYVYFDLSHQGKHCKKQVHRLVASAFLGPAPIDRPMVLHWDGIPHNNRLGNLRYGSNAENQADRHRHRMHARANAGHSIWQHVLTETEANHIHDLYMGGLSTPQLSRLLNINPRSIKRALTLTGANPRTRELLEVA